VQLQEAIKTTKVFDSCIGLARRPKQQCPGPLQFGVIYWQYFKTRHALLKHSEYSVGACGGLQYLWDSCMKLSASLKSLRISVGQQAPSSNFQLFKVEGSYLAQLEFQCNVRTFETF
jgi:hypothetical protein